MSMMAEECLKDIRYMTNDQLGEFIRFSDMSTIHHNLTYLKEFKLDVLMEVVPLFIVMKDPELVAQKYPEWCLCNKFRHVLVQYNLKWMLDNQLIWLYNNYDFDYLTIINPEIMEKYRFVIHNFLTGQNN
jgi:hypothetical protein